LPGGHRKKPCPGCGKPIRCARATCNVCRYATGLRAVKDALEAEAQIVPAIAPRATLTGSAVILSDTHIPWHDPAVILKACEAARLLRIGTLIVAGDLLHLDLVSKYVGAGKSIPVSEELRSAGRVLQALSLVFERIVIIPGNHDQRLERTIAQVRESKQGRQALDMVAALLGAGDVDDAEDVALRYLNHFLGSPKVTIHPLPDLVLNGTWLIQHPGICRRVSPQAERAMAVKHRMSIVQGHNHLFGVGLDPSGTDVCFNSGHAASPEKWRYVREKPTDFPRGNQGFGVIYTTPTNPGGRLIPVLVHDRYFDLAELAGMLAPGVA
jgi:predicted phosphodiesterase